MNTGVHLVHCLFAPLESLGLSLVDTCLHILNLRFQKFLLSLQLLSTVLFHAKLISKSCGINHSPLGLLLRHASLTGHLIHIPRQGGHFGLKLHLRSLDGLVGAGLLRKSLVGVGKLPLHHSSSAVCLFKQGACFLKGVLVGVSLAVSVDQSIMCTVLCNLFSLKLGLGIPQRGLVCFDGPLGLSIGCVGMFEAAIKVNNISLKLLFHPESLGLSLGFSLNGCLHALQSLAHVLLGRGKLFLLLSNPPLNLLPHLGQLKLSSKNLVLFLLESSLSFGESSLQFHFLGIESFADFVDLVDRTSSFANLVHDILDLIAEVFVFPPDFIQLEDSLVVGVLHLEQVR